MFHLVKLTTALTPGLVSEQGRFAAEKETDLPSHGPIVCLIAAAAWSSGVDAPV